MLRPLLLGTVGMIAASLPVAASTALTPQPAQPEQTTRATADASFLTTSGKDPYAVVFVPRRAVGQAPTRVRRTPGIAVRGQPKVVCGTLVFEADPAFDARIRIPIPNPHVRHAIRRIPAPGCR